MWCETGKDGWKHKGWGVFFALGWASLSTVLTADNASGRGSLCVVLGMRPLKMGDSTAWRTSFVFGQKLVGLRVYHPLTKASSAISPRPNDSPYVLHSRSSRL